MELPSLGRNPLNVLQIISGCERQGNDYVNASAEFTRGWAGRQQLDSDGNIEWIVCGDGLKPHGILNSHKASVFYRSVTKKPVLLSSTGYGELTPYLVSASVLIQTSAGTDITSSFTVSATAGTITETVPGTYAETTVYCSYQYDVREPGVDETLGSGKVAIIRGVGEISTLVYDTSVAYVVDDELEIASGIFTKKVSGEVAGTVVKPATYSDPRMRIRISL